MRPVVIGLLLLAVFFAGHGIYQRSQVDRCLTAAMAELPGNPLGAWAKIEPVADLSGILTLGKNSDAMRTFVAEVQQGTVKDLSFSPPDAQALKEAGDALAVFKRMVQKTDVPTAAAREAIVRAFHDKVPSLEAMGTLAAWDETLLFFQTVDGDVAWPTGLVADPKAFLKELADFPRRTIGLHDFAMRAMRGLIEGLSQCGVEYDAKGDVLARPMPLDVPDERKYNADIALTQALGDLDGFDGAFPHSRQPPEFAALRATILFVRAEIKVGHYQDKGESLRDTYDGYLSKLWIRKDTLDTPAPGIFLGMMRGSADDDLRKSAELFAGARTLQPGERAMYSTAAANALARFDNPPSAGQAPVMSTEDRQQDGTVNSVAKLPNAVGASPRAMLLTHCP